MENQSDAINTGPSEEAHRTPKRRLKRTLLRHSLQWAVLIINTLLRALVLKVVRPQFIFAAYGNRRQVSKYLSPKFAKLIPMNMILGYIRCGKSRGLMVAPQYLESELQNEIHKTRDYISRLQYDFPTADRIALVGRLPNFVQKAGIKISQPLVEGSMGTRYMMWGIARELSERAQSQGTRIAVLGGAGRIGSAVCEDIAPLFEQVVAFDLRYETDEQTGRVLHTSNPEHLQEVKLYIALTRNGDDVMEWFGHMPCGSVIADDTHPCIRSDARETLKRKGISVEKIVLSHDEFRMTPRMPDWNPRDIPGCLVEAMILQQRPDLEHKDFAAFRTAAEELGFAGRLVDPPEE